MIMNNLYGLYLVKYIYVYIYICMYVYMCVVMNKDGCSLFNFAFKKGGKGKEDVL